MTHVNTDRWTRVIFLALAGISAVAVVAAGALGGDLGRQAAAEEQKSQPEQKKEASTDKNTEWSFKPMRQKAMFKGAEYPITDGSTSAEPIGVMVACELTGTPCEWNPPTRGKSVGKSVWFGGSERRLLPVKVLTKARKTASSRVHVVDWYTSRVRHHGTHGAYRRLLTGSLSGGTKATSPAIIYECRTPSDDEHKLMAKGKIDLQAMSIALDGFVFIVHAKNPVKSLTLKQIRDIYAGKVGNWKEVGGNDATINAYVRNRNSGSQETMQSLVMKDLEITKGHNMIGMSMMGPYNLISNDPNGIGFTFATATFHRDMSNTSNVKTIAVDGIEPGAKTFASRKYPLTTEVYAVWRKDLAKDAPARKILAWLETKEARKAIQRCGYVPYDKKQKVQTWKAPEQAEQAESTGGSTNAAEIDIDG
jgi:phosphate transport system substrate-binding protein